MRRDVQDIFRLTPHEKQVMMFSATLSKDVRPVCKKFMQDVSIRTSTHARLRLPFVCGRSYERPESRYDGATAASSSTLPGNVNVGNPLEYHLSSHPRYIGGSLCLRPLSPFLASLSGFSKITDFSRARQKKKRRQRKKKIRQRKKKGNRKRRMGDRGKGDPL